jgi:hypothetical protein
MAHCVFCGAETQLYVSEQPVCLKCAEKRETRSQSLPSSTAGDINRSNDNTFSQPL